MRAIESASTMNIVRIDGYEMAKLILQYKMGVEVRKTYSIDSVNLEYFEM